MPATRRVVDIHRVNADEPCAMFDQPVSASFGEKGSILGVLGATPMTVTARVQKHRAVDNVAGDKGSNVDRSRPAAKSADNHSRQIGKYSQRKRSEVGTVGVAVIGAVHIGTGIAEHADAINRELGARRVRLA
jgi:hypothetical protein